MAIPASPSPAHVRLAPGRPDVHPGSPMQIRRYTQIAMTMEIYGEVPTAKTRSALKRLGRQLDG
jgi:hypothetical protein